MLEFDAGFVVGVEGVGLGASGWEQFLDLEAKVLLGLWA